MPRGIENVKKGNDGKYCYLSLVKFPQSSVKYFLISRARSKNVSHLVIPLCSIIQGTQRFPGQQFG